MRSIHNWRRWLHRHKAGALLYRIDFIRFTRTNGTMLITGWAFSPTTSIVSLRVQVYFADRIERRAEGKYGFARNDVEAFFGDAAARSSGFSARVAQARGDITALFLEVDFIDGQSEVIAIAVDHLPIQVGQPAVEFENAVMRIAADARPSPPFEKADTMPKASVLYSDENAFLHVLQDALASKTDRPFIFLFDHNTGGGANLYSSLRLPEYVSRGVTILRVFFDSSRLLYGVEWVDAERRLRVSLTDLTLLGSMAQRLRLDGVFLNNLYAFEDPLYILNLMLEIKHQAAAPLTIAIHDYYSICPELNLLDVHRKYCGVPDLKTCRSCLRENRSNVLQMIPSEDIAAWRWAWRRLLAEADTILGFSRASLEILRKAYPDLPGWDTEKVVLKPHSVDDFGVVA